MGVGHLSGAKRRPAGYGNAERFVDLLFPQAVGRRRGRGADGGLGPAAGSNRKATEIREQLKAAVEERLPGLAKLSL